MWVRKKKKKIEEKIRKCHLSYRNTKRKKEKSKIEIILYVKN